MQYTGTENAAQEAENIEMLAAVMGGELDHEAARQVLRKCNGDVQKAATAFIDGTANDMLKEASRLGSLNVANSEPTPTPPVIDLTAEDDELTRALNLSMQTHDSENQLRPSDRAPDPAWAVVPSTQPADARMSQDDHSLSRAIEASYNDFINSDEDPPVPLERSVRDGNKPVVFRTKSASIAYAALVLQALFFVPQVRETLAKLSVMLGDEDADCPLSPLIELYAHMDLGALGLLLGDSDLLSGFKARSCNGPNDFIGDFSAEFLRQAAFTIDEWSRKTTEPTQPPFRLFNFKYGKVVISEASPEGTVLDSAETCTVMLDISSQSAPNNLLNRLSNSLSEYTDVESKHELIFEPSQVVTFQVKQSLSFSTSPAEPFTYPKSMYMDQFLGKNLKITNEKRAQQQIIQKRLKELDQRKQILTQSNNGSDGLQALRASIHYYQHLADAKNDSERRRKLDLVLQKLKAVLKNIEEEAKNVDLETARLKDEESRLFECPELQKHKYDLRAVFIHTGIPGRRQIYSYIYYNDAWWKTVDTEVTQVTEEVVLTDTTGIHLGAGPYMLIYSESCPNDQPTSWFEGLEEQIKINNAKFLQSIGNQDVPTGNNPAGPTPSTTKETQP